MLLGETYSLRGAALTMLDDTGRIVGGVPALQAPRTVNHARRWVSLPFTDALSPLVTAPGAEELAAALEVWRAERGVDHLELRAAVSGARPAPVTAYSHVLALAPDADEVARGFSPSARRNVRSSKRRGITITRIESERELTETFFGLHVETRRRLGGIPQPRQFFRLLWERMLSHDLGFGLLAYRGATPVAGAIFLSWNNSVIYKFGASNNAFWNLRPNDALMEQAIRIACDQGRERFDFGRSDASAESLRRFKRGWGAHELPLTYSVIGHHSPVGRGRSERLVGTIVRNSPAWVAHACGRWLYRYAA